MYKLNYALLIIITLVSVLSCVSSEKATDKQTEPEPGEGKKIIELAPTNKEELFRQAKNYQQNRDYANALINIVRAEKAEGDEALDDEIRKFKNSLMESLNSRAIEKSVIINDYSGPEVPLEYMIFYTDEEIIYPAFNIPVSFEVMKGQAQITEASFTNTNGVAECEVMKIYKFEDNEILIAANMYIEIEGEIFTIQKLKRDFILHHKDIKDRSIAFVIFERNIDELTNSSISGKQIEQFFIEEGFTVLNGITENNEERFLEATRGETSVIQEYRKKLKAQLIAFTHIESKFSSKVDEDFYFAKSNIAISIVDASTYKVVFNSVIENVKGAGSTEDKAGEKAINQATNAFIKKLGEDIYVLHMQ